MSARRLCSSWPTRSSSRQAGSARSRRHSSSSPVSTSDITGSRSCSSTSTASGRGSRRSSITRWRSVCSGSRPVRCFAPHRRRARPWTPSPCGSFRGMSSRVTGAGLALIAVAFLAVSVATPAVLPAQLSLFAGHPTVANHTRETQDVYVGLYTAELCNSGGDGTCKTGDATTAFRLCGYGELGLTGVLALLAVILAMLTLRRSEGRKTVARLIWLVGALAIAGVAGLIVLG